MLISGRKKRIVMMMSLLLTLCTIRLSFESYAEEQTEEQTEGETIVVCLGDSYSSGEGIDPYYGQKDGSGRERTFVEKLNDPDFVAHRSMYAWSSMLRPVRGTRMFKDSNYYFYAASGAETSDYWNEQKKDYNVDGLHTNEDGKVEYRGKGRNFVYLPQQQKVFERLKEEGKKANYVVLTMGGNDIGFSSIAERVYKGFGAIGLWNLHTEIDNSRKQMNGSLKKNLKKMYKAIHKDSEGATILVAGYPKLFSNTTGNLLVNPLEQVMVNDAVHDFNQMIRDVVKDCKAEGLDIWFVDVEEEFNGKGAHSFNAYINGLVLMHREQDLDQSALYSAMTLHPNSEGVKAYARCVQKAMNEREKEKIQKQEKDTAEKRKKDNLKRYKELLDRIYRCAEINQKMIDDQEYSDAYYEKQISMREEYDQYGIALYSIGTGMKNLSFEFRDVTGDGKDELLLFRDSDYISGIYSEESGKFDSIWVYAHPGIGMVELESGDFLQYDDGGQNIYCHMTEKGLEACIGYRTDRDFIENEKDASYSKVTYKENGDIKESIEISKETYEKEIGNMSPTRKQKGTPLTEYDYQRMEPDNDPWINAYIGQVKQFIDDNKEFSEYAYQFALFYLDNDDVPELVMHAGKSWHPTVVCTFKNGSVLTEDLYSMGVSYIPRKGFLIEENEYKGEGGTTVYSLNSKGFQNIGGAHFSYDYFGLRNRGDYDEETIDNETTWYIRDESVSKEEYTDYVKSLYNNEAGKKEVEYVDEDEIVKKLNEYR
ncbi:MAG: SGNH/GDSL hydrolase family protein [Eubacterium sp.]|nr:SGNH/GDSL hydrolase family protein [Eubacterium sp.]